MNTKDYHTLICDKLKIKRSKIIQKNILIVLYSTAKVMVLHCYPKLLQTFVALTQWV